MEAGEEGWQGAYTASMSETCPRSQAFAVRDMYGVCGLRSSRMSIIAS